MDPGPPARWPAGPMDVEAATTTAAQAPHTLLVRVVAHSGHPGALAAVNGDRFPIPLLNPVKGEISTNVGTSSFVELLPGTSSD